VLALGGNGFYGKYFVEDVLRYTNARVLVVSRRPTRSVSDRITTASCDRGDSSRLQELAEDCAIVANLAGPFQHAPLRFAIARANFARYRGVRCQKDSAIAATTAVMVSTMRFGH
jgi:saccharopine dehydrogenase-like NADP-dependent oxidoreductase